MALAAKMQGALRRGYSTSRGGLFALASGSHLSAFTNPAEDSFEEPVMLTRGEGVYVWDTEGKRYLDTLSGLWSNALGNGNDRIVNAATTQMKKLAYQHTFWNRTTDVAQEYADRLVNFSSGIGATQAFFSSGGSDANDTNIKLAWYYWSALGEPQRTKIIAREKGYHGVTITAASISGQPKMHAGFGPLPLNFVKHVSCPHYFKYGLEGETEDQYSSRLAKEVDDLIVREGPETVACFIAEPICGAGGVIPPPAGYFEKVQAVLKKHGVLFIIDEVITGFGRTGAKFGSNFYGIQPDLITIAKAMSSSYYPLGAALLTERIADVVREQAEKFGNFGHGYTYGGHPVACAIGLETLNIYEELQPWDTIRANRDHFHEGVRRSVCTGSQLIAEVRGEGYMLAFEFIPGLEERADGVPPGTLFANIAQREGLLVRSLGDTVVLAPGFTYTEENFAELFDKLARAFHLFEQRLS